MKILSIILNFLNVAGYGFLIVFLLIGMIHNLSYFRG